MEIPWAVGNVERALRGYSIGHDGKNVPIILVSKNRIRKTISWSNSSSDTQPQLSTFTPTNDVIDKLTSFT